ncbi:hypothetical protein GUJ93_ZPchr0011g27171, partial [Zizania palustris]
MQRHGVGWRHGGVARGTIGWDSGIAGRCGAAPQWGTVGQDDKITVRHRVTRWGDPRPGNAGLRHSKATRGRATLDEMRRPDVARASWCEGAVPRHGSTMVGPTRSYEAGRHIAPPGRVEARWGGMWHRGAGQWHNMASGVAPQLGTAGQDGKILDRHGATQRVGPRPGNAVRSHYRATQGGTTAVRREAEQHSAQRGGTT